MSGLQKALLRIASRLFGAIVRIRNGCYDRGIIATGRSSLPVISVGNISVGGTGKTPLCLYLATLLGSLGRKPVILSRGYGGSIRGPHRVRGDEHPSKVGDEPLLMASKNVAPVVIAKRRVAGARFIEREKLGDVILLDDGFQHRRLGRDLDIVVINVGTEKAIEDFVAGDLLPLGRNREPRDRALERAGFVVLSERRPLERAGALDPRISFVLPPQLPRVRSFITALNVISIVDGEQLATREVVAFCGIANPESFFKTLEELGFTLLGRRPYRDHHEFSEQDIAELRREFPHRALVCTEKDAPKLRQLKLENVYALQVATVFDARDAAVLEEAIKRTVDQKAGAPAK